MIPAITGSNDDLDWKYEVAPGGRKVHLLTIGGTACHGTWTGELGEFYLAYAKLPRRDKKREREILAEREARLKAAKP